MKETKEFTTKKRTYLVFGTPFNLTDQGIYDYHDLYIYRDKSDNIKEVHILYDRSKLVGKKVTIKDGKLCLDQPEHKSEFIRLKGDPDNPYVEITRPYYPKPRANKIRLIEGKMVIEL